MDNFYGCCCGCGHDYEAYSPPVLEGKTLADLNHPKEWGDFAEVLFRLAGGGVADSFTPDDAKPLIWRLLLAAAWGAIAVRDRDESTWENAEMMALGAVERLLRRKRATAAGEEVWGS